MEEQQKRGPRRVFTREYKLEAVRLASEGGRTVAGVALDLGLSEHTLHKWRKQFRSDPAQAFPGNGRLKPQDDEVRRLRRVFAQAEQERDFLRRAALWLAQEAHRSTGS